MLASTRWRRSMSSSPSSNDTFTSARSAEQTLNRVTWTLLVLFLALAVVLSAGWLA